MVLGVRSYITVVDVSNVQLYIRRVDFVFCVSENNVRIRYYNNITWRVFITIYNIIYQVVSARVRDN